MHDPAEMRWFIGLVLASGVLNIPAGAGAQGYWETTEVGQRTVRVYVPQTSGQGPRAVLVAQDGQNLFGGGPNGSWDLHHALERVMAQGARPAVILGVD